MIAITNSERATYNKLVEDYRAKNMKPIINWHSITLLSAALGTANNIPFEINQSNGGQLPQNASEQRLNIVDKFTATRVMIGLVKVATGSTVAANKTHNWVNPQIFTGSGEAAALRNIYRGWLQLQVNSTVYFPGLDMYNFWVVPELPELVAQTVTSGIDAAAQSYITSDAKNGSEDGFIELIPTVTFSGGKKNVIQINLPASAAMAGTSSSNYVILQFRGFLHQNVNSKNINEVD